MLHAKRNIVVTLTAALFAASVACADDSPETIKLRIGDGDPIAGKIKSVKCQECHGKDGNNTSPDTPKLAGQYATYIERQIRAYQSSSQTGVHSNPEKSGIASGATSHQDLLDISAYFASQKQMKGSGTGNKAGKALYLEGNADSNLYGCINCHGENGKGHSPENTMFPVIGGQHKKYLIQQITAFNKGERTNDPSGMMCNVAKRLTRAEIEAVADYISGL